LMLFLFASFDGTTNKKVTNEGIDVRNDHSLWFVAIIRWENVIILNIRAVRLLSDCDTRHTTHGQTGDGDTAPHSVITPHISYPHAAMEKCKKSTSP
jgi:hypothetical protein